MYKIIDNGLTFDDVLLQPQFSKIKSRSEVNLEVNFPKNFKYKIPFIPANMKDIISEEVLIQSYNIGGLSFLHRFLPIEDQLKILLNLKSKLGNQIFDFIGVSVGVKEEDYKNIILFCNIGVKIILIDIAHLDSTLGISMIKHISENYSEMLLIAGNIATYHAAARAFRAGADVVKIGIGSGTICSTRIEAAAGVPQLSAIIEVDNCRKNLEKELGRKLSIISDGGARNAGCCVKALCFADMVMMGGYFAGCLESPGEEIEINGKKLKSYHGSSTHKSSRIEGVKASVISKGSILDLYQKLIEGVQSGCSYQNAFNLNELKENPIFIRISPSGLSESKIHDVMVIK